VGQGSGTSPIVKIPLEEGTIPYEIIGKNIEVEHADVFELFDNPLHPYTLGLMKSILVTTSRKENKELHCIEGMVPNLLYLPKGCKFYPRCEQRRDICKEKEPGLVNVGNNHHVRCWLYH